MSRVVRSSKYRHVFGQPFRKEDCYDELKITRSAWDSNYVTASPLYLGVIWEAAGGGSFAVIPWKTTGKLTDAKLITGHKGAVLDIEFNPFNDSLIASASEDCYAKLWSIPEGGLTSNMSEPVQTLTGHKRKVGAVKFNPVANNVLATTSIDYSVKIWDIEKGAATISIDGQHTDIINWCDWNYNGSSLVTVCKDKKIRIFDPRIGKAAQEGEAHQGIKPSRAIFLGNKEKIFSTGFTKTSEREFCIWDPKDLSKPLVREQVDSASGLLMPFYDNDTGVLFLAGKGDGNVRLYEMVDEAPYNYYLTEYKSSTPQRGMCMLPKRAVNVSDCEVVRMLKVGVKTIEPISMQVPRKSDVFQDDIFPDCYAGEPTVSSSEWFGGKNGEVKTQSMAPGFVQKKAVAEFNPEKVVEAKPLSDKELRDMVDQLTKRVAYLESEIVKKDSRLKELESKE